MVPLFIMTSLIANVRPLTQHGPCISMPVIDVETLPDNAYVHSFFVSDSPPLVWGETSPNNVAAAVAAGTAAAPAVATRENCGGKRNLPAARAVTEPL